MPFTVRSMVRVVLSSTALLVTLVVAAPSSAAVPDPTPELYPSVSALGLDPTYDPLPAHPVGEERLVTLEIRNYEASTAINDVHVRVPIPAALAARVIDDGAATCTLVASLLTCVTDIPASTVIDVQLGLTPTTASTSELKATTWSTARQTVSETRSLGGLRAQGSATTAALTIGRWDTSDPIRARAGSPTSVQWNLHNDGPATTNARVDLTLASAALATFSAANDGSSGCTKVDDRHVSCQYSSVAPDSDTTVDVAIDPSAPGAVNVTANALVISPGITLPGGATSVTEPITISPAGTTDLRVVDASVSMYGNSGSLSVLGLERYRFAAAGTTVLVELHGATVTDISTPGSGCTGTGTSTIECNTGALAAGGVISLSADVARGPGAGAISGTARVTTTDADLDATNNALPISGDPSGGGNGHAAITLYAAGDRVNLDDGTLGIGVLRLYVYENEGVGRSDARVSVDLPSDVTVPTPAAVTGAHGCAVAAGRLECELDNLSAYGSLTVRVPFSVAAGTWGHRFVRAAISGPVPGSVPLAQRGERITIDNADAAVAELRVSSPTVLGPWVGWGMTPIAQGTPLDATLTVSNRGTATATASSVRIVIPRGMDAATAIGEVDDDGARTCSRAGRVLTCTTGDIAPGGSAYIDIRSTAIETGTWTIGATARAASGVGAVAAHASSEFIIEPAASSDLRVSTVQLYGTSDPAKVLMRFSISSRTRTDAASATATVSLPAGITLTGTPISTQGTCAGSGTVVCGLGTIPGWHTADIELTLALPATVPVAPVATLSVSASSSEATPDDNTVVYAMPLAGRPDLQATVRSPRTIRLQSGGADRLVEFDTTNLGGDTIGEVRVDVTGPAGITLASPSTSDHSCVSVTAKLLRCTWAYGGTGSLPVTINAGPGAANGRVIARVFAAGDTSAANDVANVPVILDAPASADIDARLVLPTRSLAIGERARVQLVARNDSSVRAEDVTIILELPDGLTLDWRGADAGSCTAVGSAPQVVTCPLGDIYGGEYLYASLLVRGAIAGSWPLVATATSVTPDPAATNDVATGSIRVRGAAPGVADLSLRSGLETCDVVRSRTCDVTVWLDNDGPAATTTATMQVDAPSGVSITRLDVSGASCSINSGDGSCVFAALERDESVPVRVRIRGDELGSVAVTARITSSVPIDPLPDGGELAIPVRVTSTDTSVSATMLDFGVVAVNTQSARTVSFTAAVGGDLLLLREPFVLGVSSARFSVTHDCATTLSPGESCTVTVRFSPIAEVGSAGDLVFETLSGVRLKYVNLSGIGDIPPRPPVTTGGGSGGSGGSTSTTDGRNPTGTTGGSTTPDPTRGTAHGDVFRGASGNDLFRAAGGNDVLSGGAGFDRLFGEAGNDRISGNAGNDVLDGGPGIDRIDGGAGNDKVYGGTGNDRLFGGPGKDFLAGGAGNDVIMAKDGTRDVIDCGLGKDAVFADAIDVVRNCEMRR